MDNTQTAEAKAVEADLKRMLNMDKDKLRAHSSQTPTAVVFTKDDFKGGKGSKVGNAQEHMVEDSYYEIDR